MRAPPLPARPTQLTNLPGHRLYGRDDASRCEGWHSRSTLAEYQVVVLGMGAHLAEFGPQITNATFHRVRARRVAQLIHENAPPSLAVVYAKRCVLSLGPYEWGTRVRSGPATLLTTCSSFTYWVTRTTPMPPPPRPSSPQPLGHREVSNALGQGAASRRAAVGRRAAAAKRHAGGEV